jgi:hypothetical protein
MDNAIRYSSANRRYKISSVVGNVFKTEAAHGFVNGQKKRLHNMGGNDAGLSGLNNLTVKVQNCTANTLPLRISMARGVPQPYLATTAHGPFSGSDGGLGGRRRGPYGGRRAH